MIPSYILLIITFIIKVKLILNMQPLKDPKNTRVVKTLPLPPHKPLPSNEIFKPNNKIDWQLLRTFLKKEGRIERDDF